MRTGQRWVTAGSRKDFPDHQQCDQQWTWLGRPKILWLIPFVNSLKLNTGGQEILTVVSHHR